MSKIVVSFLLEGECEFVAFSPPLGGGVLPYLTRWDVPLNRVSFYGKNYATGCPFLIKLCDRVLQLIRKLCDTVSCGTTFYRVLLKLWIM